ISLPMRILLTTIYDVRRSGGLSSHTGALEAALRRAGHEVTRLTPHSALSRGAIRFRLDVPRALARLSNRSAGFLAYLRVSKRLLSRALAGPIARGVDVIHAHDAMALLAAREAVASRPGTPDSARPLL